MKRDLYWNIVVYVLNQINLKTPRAPYFTQNLVDVQSQTGDDVALKCCFDGYPTPRITWQFGDNTTLKYNYDCQILQQGHECKLHFPSVRQKHSGIYRCILENELGRAESECFLSVGSSSLYPIPPQFIRCLYDIWTPLDNEITLTCQTIGIPNPDITWYFNGQQLLENSNVRLFFDANNVCGLTIVRVSGPDLGQYVCEARNEYGIAKTAATIHAGEPHTGKPPIFLKGLQDQTVHAGSRITMGVLVKGEHAYKLSKKYEETVIITGFPDGVLSLDVPTERSMKTRRKIPKRLTLKEYQGEAPEFIKGLKDVELEEGGRAAVSGRTCKRKLPKTQDEQSPSLCTSSKVKTVEDIRAIVHRRNECPCEPKFIIRPRERKEIEEGKSLRLKAALSASPTAQVSWNKDGVMLESGSKYGIYNDGDFYYIEVHRVNADDSGFYNCIASNTHGVASASSHVVILPGSPEKAIRPPTFTEVLPGVVDASIGECVSVECSFEGKPIPHVTWTKNGNTLTPSSRVQLTYDGESASLTVNKVEYSDAGRYCCKAVNCAGEARSTTKIKVKSASELDATVAPMPKFLHHLVDQTVGDGDQVTFTLQLVDAWEPIKITWFHDKCEIQDSPAFSYVRDGDKCILIIQDAFPEDSGVYMCRAENAYGQAISACTLTVIGKEEDPEIPSFTEIPEKATAVIGQSVTISVNLKGYPEPVVSWSKDNAALSSGEKYQIYNVGNSHHMTVLNCGWEDAGTYRILATNNVGSFAPSGAEVAIGDPLQLNCSFTGQPCPVVVWYFNGKRVEPSELVSVIHTENASFLTVKSCQEEHFGEVSVSIRNQYGEDLASAHIKHRKVHFNCMTDYVLY
ncbi:putative immunoglobulin I-set domain protein [Trichinella spiralis]|uniref:putative immunoglobulin I-set domain protein n=1 Tax=Trichinella spiralis TaxID=6334 RepID=UPI0001EFE70F|nr:putative immunoglobulin I-set domain protein [Trichinella spiralis]